MSLEGSLCFLYGEIAKSDPKENIRGRTEKVRVMASHGTWRFPFSLGCCWLMSRNGWGTLYTVSSATPKKHLGGFLHSWLPEGTSKAALGGVLTALPMSRSWP